MTYVKFCLSAKKDCFDIGEGITENNLKITYNYMVLECKKR